MDEFLSTILTDPGLSTRLADALEALRRGVPLETALEKAGIDKKRGEAIVRELSGLLRRYGAPEGRGTGAAAWATKLVAFADGGSRGNPGPAACAVILYNEHGDELLRRAKMLGTQTNNAAEYEGVLLALELATQLKAGEFVLKIDSELVVRQLQGSYKVKHPALRQYHARARALIDTIGSFTVLHIPRGENKDTDKLVNACLDGEEL